MFRRHRNRKDGEMSAEASLAEAEAARRTQERKHSAERPVNARLTRLAEENHLAELFRAALGDGR
jgi:hypothetical protein